MNEHLDVTSALMNEKASPAGNQALRGVVKNSICVCLYDIQTGLFVKEIVKFAYFLVKILWLYNIHRFV